MIRCFDFFFSLIGLIFLSPLIILIFFIGLFENGSTLFIQNRVGQNLKSFLVVKFRTMPVNTRSAGTHLIKNIQLSPFRYFLRKSKIDEIYVDTDSKLIKSFCIRNNIFVIDRLKRLSKDQNCSVLMVTHDPRITDMADRILNMEDGKIF